MQPVLKVSEVFEAVQDVKAAATAFQTNFFPVRSKLQDWIEHAELFREAGEGFVLFLRKDREFFHLYFCARDLNSLMAGVRPRPERLTVDLVGAELALEGLRRLFESAGFHHHTRLCRLARLVQGIDDSSASRDDSVTFADGADSLPIDQMLSRAFDPYAEQLPQPYEIESAIEGRQILLVKRGGILGGLLFFETQGLTSTVRYWLVGEAQRGQGAGGALMRCYFALHPNVRRFLLWVIDINRNAISKYAHYGFVPDGLVDHVLTN
jgi:hypothetical protein